MTHRDVLMVGQFPADPAMIKGGVQASVYGICRALARRDDIGRVAVHALPLKPGRHPVEHRTIEGIEVTFLTAPHKFLATSIVHIPALLSTLRGMANPVAHIHGTGLFQTALILYLRLARRPFVWTVHGILEKETWQKFRQNRSLQSFLRYAFYLVMERLCRAFSPVISVGTDYVRAALHMDETRVDVIPQGIFIEEFAGPAHPPAVPPFILSLGVIDPRKGHHLTMVAFASIRAAVPDARLAIAGALTIPAYHEALKTGAVELGLAGAVEIDVNLPRREIIALLKKATVLALHSQEESQGLALCEAMALGLPIVATRVGGIPYVITEGVDGLLVDYGDVAGFATAITRLLQDAELRNRLAAAARAASVRYDWRIIAEKFTCLYQCAAETLSAPAAPVPAHPAD